MPPGRRPAPHIEAAVSAVRTAVPAAVQAKPGQAIRPPAPHVAAALRPPVVGFRPAGGGIVLPKVVRGLPSHSPGILRPAFPSPPLPVRPAIAQPMRQSTRVSRPSFETWLRSVWDDIIDHIDTAIGAVADNPVALDLVAAALVPAHGPGAANCAAVQQTAVGRHAVAWNQPLLPTAQAYYGVANGMPHPGAGTRWDYVQDTRAGKHAEMKILDAAGGAPAYIGISKACCRPCAMVLHIAGVGSRGRHADANTNWAFPDFILNSDANIEAFIGGYAWNDLEERNNDDVNDPGFRRELASLLHLLAQRL